MKKPALLLKLIQHIEQKKAEIKLSASQDDTGFTLIELLVVIIMIGVLAAAAAPSWVGFVNQRRASSANELVFRALQEAQSLAKSKKVSYSVSFRRDNNGVPEIAVYQTKKSDGSDFQPYNWKSFQEELSLRPGQITLGTNLTNENEVGTNVSYNNLNNNKKITFDYMGALAGSTNLNDPITIVVGVPTNNGVIQSTKRCVQITTLLGSLKIDRAANCN